MLHHLLLTSALSYQTVNMISYAVYRNQIYVYVSMLSLDKQLRILSYITSL